MITRALLLLLVAATITGCANSKITKTYVATGATDPKVIFIRPFTVDGPVTGLHRGGAGELGVRSSLLGREFADALKIELAKMAPTAVLSDNEKPMRGWVVDGELQLVATSHPFARFALGHAGAGASHVVAHVRIRDLGMEESNDDAKSGHTGNVIYEFDVEASSKLSGPAGTVYAPGLGYSVPFDFKNAAERVMLALSRDPYREGDHSTPVFRYW